MKKIILAVVSLSMLLPSIASATTTQAWISSTTPPFSFISPNIANGVDQAIKVFGTGTSTINKLDVANLNVSNSATLPSSVSISGFTQGSVIFAGALGTLVQNNAQFFWDNTNNRLGISSTTPYGQLSINPNGITGPSFVIGSSTRTSFLVDNGGNVSVATTSDGYKVHTLGLVSMAGDNGTRWFETRSLTGGFAGGMATYVNCKESFTENSNLTLCGYGPGTNTQGRIKFDANSDTGVGGTYIFNGANRNPILAIDAGTNAITYGTGGTAQSIVKWDFSANNRMVLDMSLDAVGSPTFTYKGNANTDGDRTKLVWRMTDHNLAADWFDMSGLGYSMFGTSSAAGLVTIASTSAGTKFLPQLVLTDTAGGANLKHVYVENLLGNLYVGPLTDALATSSPTLTVLNGGNTGISTSSPYSKLSVAGQVVAQNYVGTSSAATSTLAGGALLANEAGSVGISTSTPSAKLGVTGDVFVDGQITIFPTVAVTNSSLVLSGPVNTYTRANNGNAAIRNLYQRARGSFGAETAVVADDNIMRFISLGYDGSAYVQASEFSSVVDGTVSAGLVSSYFKWQTRNAAGSLAERMRLTAEGNIVVTGDVSSSGNIVAAGATSVVRLKGYTVATLPAGTQGDTAFATDLLAPGFLVVAVGGGTVVGPVMFNGTNWIAY